MKEKEIDVLNAFRKYNSLIYNYIYFRVGKNKELAEDLTQEVFLKAFNNKTTYDSKKASEKTWLFIIARSTVLDSYKKPEQELISYEELIGKYDENNLQKITLDIALKKMKPMEKELVEMKYILGLKTKEIAKIIGKSNSATKVSVRRAFYKLKQICNE